MLFTLFILVRFHGETQFFYLYYMAPIAVPFVAFLLARLETFPQTNWPQHLLDVVIVALAILRNFVEVPFISGHALFLAYCLFSARTAIARITAALVLVAVVLMKIINWGDFYTPTGGILLGVAAALVYQAIQTKQEQLQAQKG